MVCIRTPVDRAVTARGGRPRDPGTAIIAVAGDSAHRRGSWSGLHQGRRGRTIVDELLDNAAAWDGGEPAMRPSRAAGVADCRGPLSRREILRAGLAGFAGLSLPELFRLRVQAATPPGRAKTVLVVVWLHGGASHLESFDPKPDAPS